MATAAETRASTIAKLQEEMANRLLDKKLDTAIEMLSLQITRVVERLEFSNRDKLILDPRSTRTRAESANTNPYWFHLPWFEGNQYSGEIHSPSLLNSSVKTPVESMEDEVLVEVEEAKVFDKMSELNLKKKIAENGESYVCVEEIGNRVMGWHADKPMGTIVKHLENIRNVSMMKYELPISKEVSKLDEVFEEFELDEFSGKLEYVSEELNVSNETDSLFELTSEENEILKLPIGKELVKRKGRLHTCKTIELWDKLIHLNSSIGGNSGGMDIYQWLETILYWSGYKDQIINGAWTYIAMNLVVMDTLAKDKISTDIAKFHDYAVGEETYRELGKMEFAETVAKENEATTWEKRRDNFILGGVMAASFNVIQYPTSQNEVLQADSEELHVVQKDMKLIFNLRLLYEFDTFPTFLCANGCSKIDKNMRSYGYPIEIQELFFSALSCASSAPSVETSTTASSCLIPSRMKAWTFNEYDVVGVMKLDPNVAIPKENNDHVLIKVTAAAALNPVDFKKRHGKLDKTATWREMWDQFSWSDSEIDCLLFTVSGYIQTMIQRASWHYLDTKWSKLEGVADEYIQSNSIPFKNLVESLLESKLDEKFLDSLRSQPLSTAMERIESIFFLEVVALLLHSFCVYHISPHGNELGASDVFYSYSMPFTNDLSYQILEGLKYCRFDAVLCLDVMASAHILNLFAMKNREQVLGLIIAPLWKTPVWIQKLCDNEVRGNIEVQESAIVQACRIILGERQSTIVLHFLQAKYSESEKNRKGFMYFWDDFSLLCLACECLDVSLLSDQVYNLSRAISGMELFWDPWGQGSTSAGVNVMTRIISSYGKEDGDELQKMYQWLLGEEELCSGDDDAVPVEV